MFIMLVGVAGSGKSQMANNYHEKYKNSIILSSDSIRKELYGDEEIQGNPKEVFKIMDARTEKYLKLGLTVIYDATNIDANRRKDLLKRFENIVGSAICIYLNTSLELCIKRQNLRKRKVPELIIRRQYSHLQPPKYDEGWDKIIEINN